MLDKGVFTPIHPHQQKGLKIPIRSHMFLKEKYDSEGNFLKLKARLVAGGNMQSREDVPSEDISSPTAAMPFLFAIASIAASENRHVYTADVPVANLNADNSRHGITMDPTISATIAELEPSYQPFIRPNRTIVVRLNKAISGCIESARLWYELFRATLETQGFIANPLDPCIMNTRVADVQCTCVIYVDDLMFTSTNNTIILRAIKALEERFKSKLKVTEGTVHSYLGMCWDYSIPGCCKVTMPGYTSELLQTARTKGTASSPAAPHLFTVRDTIEILNPDIKEEFHTLVAKALYLAKRTRPDILLPVSFLSTRVQAPNIDDWSKLQRLFKYINATPEFGIVLEGSKTPIVETYIDASYGVHSDFRSHSGMIVSMGGAPIDSKSTKQKINTKSSAEAELIALSDMCSRVIWCRQFLIAQGYNLPPSPVYQDNQSTISLGNKGCSVSDRTRHVSIRYFWMKDRVDAGDIQIVYKPTSDMIADILTKPIQGEQFLRLRNLLLNWKV
jgi:hypothetical protein